MTILESYSNFKNENFKPFSQNFALLVFKKIDISLTPQKRSTPIKKIKILSRREILENNGLVKRKKKKKDYSLLSIWQGMKQRCYNKKATSYKYYGKRGISICGRWRDSYKNFYEDMAPRPVGLSIDRINNDGNYCKENCRWATAKQQANNKRKRSVCS